MGMYNLMSELARRDVTMTIEHDEYPMPIWERPSFQIKFSKVNPITNELFNMKVHIHFENVERMRIPLEDILMRHLERFMSEYSLATTFVDNWKKEDLR